jgi:hypothetical protein
MISSSVPSFLETLLSQMTLQEKVSMLAGTNMWYTVPVERLGIPSLKMTDGSNGARGAGSLTGGVKDLTGQIWNCRADRMNWSSR